MTPESHQSGGEHAPHDDSIDYALGFAVMIQALLPYWQQQESMPPEQAIRKLISEHEVMLEVLSEIADGVDACEPYSAWARRVVEGLRAKPDGSSSQPNRGTTTMDYRHPLAPSRAELDEQARASIPRGDELEPDPDRLPRDAEDRARAALDRADARRRLDARIDRIDKLGPGILEPGAGGLPRTRRHDHADRAAMLIGVSLGALIILGVELSKIL